MGFEPARQRYIASQKPNTLPTELSVFLHCFFFFLLVVALCDLVHNVVAIFYLPYLLTTSGNIF